MDQTKQMDRSLVPCFLPDYELGGQRQACLARLGVPAFMSALDVGTANGHFARALAAYCPSAAVLGIDIVPAFIDEAIRQTPPDLMARVDYQVGGLGAIELPHRRFDLIAFFCSMRDILYRCDFEDVMTQAAMLCRSGGKILIADSFSDADMDCASRLGLELNSTLGYRFQNRSAVKVVLEAQGFMVQSEVRLEVPRTDLSGMNLLDYCLLEYRYNLQEGRKLPAFTDFVAPILERFPDDAEVNIEPPVDAILAIKMS